MIWEYLFPGTPIDIWIYFWGIVFVTVLTTIYTAIGGIKAVIWTDVISSSIDEALEHGFVLWLISLEALDSRSVVMEMREAFERQATSDKRARIIPVLIRGAADTITDTVARLASLVPGAEGIAVAAVNDNDFDDGIARLVDDLKHRPV